MQLYKVIASIDANGYNMSCAPYEATERPKTFTVFKPDSSFSKVKALVVKKNQVGAIESKITPPIMFLKKTWCHEDQVDATKEYLRSELLKQVAEYIKNMSVRLEELMKVVKREDKNDTSGAQRSYSKLDKLSSAD